jgi:hypothetical protein
MIGDDHNDILKLKEHLIGVYKSVTFYDGDEDSLDTGLDYLGANIKINKKNKSVTISQIGYLKKIIKELNITDTYVTPLAITDDLISKKVNEADIIKDEKVINAYLSKLMKLQYLLMSRMDIATAVAFLSTKTNKLTNDDFNTLDRVYGYLNYTQSYTLTLKPKSINLCTYVDSSHGIYYSSHSQTGFIVSLGPIRDGYNGTIVYGSKKIDGIAQSSCESELKGILEVINYISWSREILDDIGYKQYYPTNIYNDNQASIKMISSGHANFSNSKHILKIVHLLDSKENEEKLIKMKYLNSNILLADYFTKILAGSKYKKYTEILQNLSNIQH